MFEQIKCIQCYDYHSKETHMEKWLNQYLQNAHKSGLKSTSRELFCKFTLTMLFDGIDKSRMYRCSHEDIEAVQSISSPPPHQYEESNATY
eukprot:c520_g1_i1 orf=230-502(+)